MRLTRASLLAYAVMAVLSITVVVAGVGDSRLARLFALQPARADGHRAIAQGETCASCHTSTHRPPLTGACEECHVTQDWRSTSHRHETKWLDEGGHKGVACSRCHKGGANPAQTGCPSCHSAARHLRNDDCGHCHSVGSWKDSHTLPAKHPALTGDHARAACPDCHTLHSAGTTWKCTTCHEKHTVTFALDGAHKKPSCVSCHSVTEARDNLNKVAVRAGECASCHKLKHRSLADCAKCHKPTKFADSTFKHSSTDFPLTGAHEKLDCAKCHWRQQFADNDGKACVSCHGARHGGLTDCLRCHTTAGFTGTRFDHDSTGFRLTGEHGKLDCGKCHPGLRFTGNDGKACVSCHGQKHGGLKDCLRCHTTVGFARTTFKHASVYPLGGAHAKLACERCHPRREWANANGSAGACAGCHGAKHGGLKDCARCHTTTAFEPSTFKHETVYPLAGAHAKLACEKCHPRREWANPQGSAGVCASCHGSRHGGLKDCARCHTTTAFKPSTFKHESAYRLDGAHTKLACEKCHEGGRWGVAKGTTCAACHGTKHGGQVRCERCHITTAWVPLKPVTHTSRYPLTGAHKYVDCIYCHPGPKFAGTPTRCYSCHADLAHCDHKDCERCHTTESWRDIKPHEMQEHTDLPGADPEPTPTPDPPADDSHSHVHEEGS